MRIVADENIPCVREAFGAWGDVTTLAGHAMTPDAVREADVLLVRSVTRVDEALLTDSRVKYVASATSGTDHVDLGYLARNGIGFCDAPGSNADAVAQYVIVALHAVAARLGRRVSEMSIGIIGVGQVGSRLSRLCEALGMRVVWNDPPLAAQSNDLRYRPLTSILNCDVLTLHVPLSDEGPLKTRELVNEEFLEAMRPGAVLINTCRGGVVDESALKRAIDGGKLAACVLDVWRNEPRIDSDLLETVTFGTPHIAGYSVEGKLRGTQMIHDGLASMMGIESGWYMNDYLPSPPPAVRVWSPLDLGVVLRGVYDIERDDAALREAIRASDGSGFHALRKNYPPRREFSAVTVDAAECGARDAELLEALGFRLAGG